MTSREHGLSFYLYQEVLFFCSYSRLSYVDFPLFDNVLTLLSAWMSTGQMSERISLFLFYENSYESCSLIRNILLTPPWCFFLPRCAVRPNRPHCSEKELHLRPWSLQTLSWGFPEFSLKMKWNEICVLQLPREPHRLTRLLQLTWQIAVQRDDVISITLRQV